MRNFHCLWHVGGCHAASAWTVNPLQEKMLAASVQSIVTLCGGRRGWNQSDCALQSLASCRWLAWWTRKSWSWLSAQGGTFLAHQDTLSRIQRYWKQDCSKLSTIDIKTGGFSSMGKTHLDLPFSFSKYFWGASSGFTATMLDSRFFEQTMLYTIQYNII